MKATAIEGKELIRSLQKTVGAKIEILAGSGINKDNAKDLIEYTKVRYIHLVGHGKKIKQLLVIL